jgi:mediator of RNA polymerase II transcription subunit 5
MDAMIQDWTTFFDRCFAYRATREEIEAGAAQLHAKSPLPGPKLAATLLRPRSASTSVDPLIYICLERLLALKKVDASDVLSSVFLNSKDRFPKTDNADASKNAKWHNPPDLEEIVFHRLTKGFQTEERPGKNSEGLGTLIVLTRWMQAMVTSHTSDSMLQAMNGIQQSPQQQSINVREALGMIVVAVVENSKMLRILDNPKVKGR